MRSRSFRARVWLNDRETRHFKKSVELSGLSQEAYLRSLIMGYHPKPKPPPDYFSLLQELHSINGNLSHLAALAGAAKAVDTQAYWENVAQLRKAILEIQRAVELPERREKE